MLFDNIAKIIGIAINKINGIANNKAINITKNKKLRIIVIYNLSLKENPKILFTFIFIIKTKELGILFKNC